MTINEIIWTSVGADLSCTSPIYRPSVHLIDNLIIWLNRIIAPGKRNSTIQGVQ